jgi:serpin B
MRTHRSRAVGLAALGLAGLVASCGGGAGAVVTADVPRATPAADGSAAAASTAGLAADLYRQIAASTDGNLLLSPYSIELALAMARNGAAGETRRQIDAVLRAGPGDELDQSLNALEQELADRSGPRGEKGGGNGDVVLSAANSIWAQKDYAFEQPFLDTLASDYGAGVHLVDYGKDADGARRKINGWVAHETHDRITDLLPDGSLDAMTRMVLANAMYFKAPWLEPLDDAGHLPFTSGAGAALSVPAMTGDEGGRFGAGPGYRAASLPYLGSELSMVLIVPDDLRSFEQSLDGATLAAVTGSIDQPLDGVQMPKFSFRTQVSLRDQLSALGMPLAFDDGADFSALTKTEPVEVSDIYHQAFVAVDEEGTEAAASTAVVFKAVGKAVGGKSLIVDKPFLFAIRDTATGTILFLGRVTDPTAG